MEKNNLLQVVLELYRIGVFQFGNFTLKTGLLSPIYVDLRRIISKPQLLQSIADLMWNEFLQPADIICGVPYTALPIATLLSVKHDIPMVLKRKEEKSYGLKKRVEGIFRAGERCLIVEDVITSGSSILETKAVLEQEGLIVTEVIVFLNRKQGGEKNLSQKGLTIHSVCDLPEILNMLLSAEKIDRFHYDKVLDFLTIA